MLIGEGKVAGTVEMTINSPLPSDVLKNFRSERYLFSTTIKDCLFAEASGVGFAINNLSFDKKEETSKNGKPEYWAGIQGAMLFQKDKMKGILKLKEGCRMKKKGNPGFVFLMGRASSCELYIGYAFCYD
ncbi:hypothetical protein [Paenibacillus sp.]|uniref:hypothetical protein n=1 Tax=Paenibacillus sp. TaxID=58172 RepID=UPI0028AD9C3C|nr:hypothetical protein [Paenibacillus sp.]